MSVRLYLFFGFCTACAIFMLMLKVQFCKTLPALNKLDIVLNPGLSSSLDTVVEGNLPICCFFFFSAGTATVMRELVATPF